MSRYLANAVVPLLIAASLLAWREHGHPRRAEHDPRSAPMRSIVLPAPQTAREVDASRIHQLDPDYSIVRFGVVGRFDELVAYAPQATATLEFAPDGSPRTLDLEIELYDLLDDAGNHLDADQWRLLGVAASTQVHFCGQAIGVRQLPVPGVKEVTWAGRLVLGTHVRHVKLELWQSSITQGQVRLQGVGTVLARDFGLPQRYLLGLLPEQNRITMGLDMLFRPKNGH